MGEQQYCYKKVKLPNGKFGYERVPYNPNDDFLEPPTIVPKHAPLYKNGEFPGQGSVVVDRIMQMTRAAQAQRAAREAQEKRDQEAQVASRQRELQQAKAPQPSSDYKRIVELTDD